uniref:Triacylglycerol lipase n=1 Tax=Amphilophus citrinellus TaxID=61819 RepID=A0A3Q0RKW5_AMPCI
MRIRCQAVLGCFDDLPPWGGTTQRPASALPWHPEEIGTRFLLITQQNQYYQEIKADQTIEASNYGSKRATQFIIPGYLVKGDEDWPQEMCKVMLKRGNVNCIVVEWKKGVKTRYVQAANNARVVAAQVASMITFLMEHYKQRADKFRIIGHSLGAHAAGEAGSKIPGLARITGLDPTEPYFQGTDPSVHLETSDATFVDVIHTDGLPFNSKLGLGMSESVGHVDFYPNGGELMPGCSANKGSATDLDAIWEGTKKFDACNHARAYEYYSESILQSKGFVGYPCSDKDSFAFVSFFIFGWKVTVTLDGPMWPNLGSMYVALDGTSDSTKEFQLHVGTMTPGRNYDMLIDAEVDVGEVTEVKFRWNNHIINPLKPKYGASKVELQRGKDSKIVSFCGTGTVVENAIQSVLPCRA